MAETIRHIDRMTAAALMTAEELLALNLPDKRTELVRGRLIVREPAGYQHGDVAMRIGAALFEHCRGRQLGRVFAAETGFTLFRNPDTVRAPDAAFIRTERLLAPSTRGFPELAPDLAVEVLSPDDRPGEVLEKAADWLKAGCAMVWVIDPIRQRARVYRADGSQAELARDEALDGEALLPGFTCRLDSLFD
ncbi:MAG: Uma2 family endonuclease [Gemmatimonadaceae bacterium]|nr:Uma2 family endonuclease [Gemmatimonadaceae bacterium]